MNQPETMNPTSAGASAFADSPTSSGGNGTVARTVSDASTTAHGAIDKVSNAARPAVDRLATGAHQAVDKIADAAGTAAESLVVRTEQLKNAHSRMTDECRVYVRANPLAAVGVALAAGFVLSRLFRSR
jgi:ElaB/YqjD/DUF883 family membrane-anchored ribosome-binding protein